MKIMIWLVIGPQTRTVRAQEVLSAAGIIAQRRKLTETGSGCVHAVGVSDFARKRAAAVLEGVGIRIKSEIKAPE